MSASELVQAVHINQCFTGLRVSFSVTRLGYFLKVLSRKFSCKSCPKISTFLKKINVELKTVAATFCATFGKLGLLFIPKSVHSS